MVSDSNYATCATHLNLCLANATQSARANVRKTLIIVYLRKKLQQMEEAAAARQEPLQEALAMKVPDNRQLYQGNQKQVQFY